MLVSSGKRKIEIVAMGVRRDTDGGNLRVFRHRTLTGGYAV